tara:strand:+ start:1849 stop:2364 length:516 start_codon:yes stop_codon:yes gene_type:complete
MKKETKIEVMNNKSGLKLDYDDASPFTGNDCVLVEMDETTGAEARICMETGYTTTDRFTVGNPALEQYELTVPQLYKDTKYLDPLLNQYWYLATMRTALGCLYADGTSKDDYKWKLAPVRELTDEEKVNYPVEGKDPVEYHTHIIDIENPEIFEQDKFQACMDKFYSLIGR